MNRFFFLCFTALLISFSSGAQISMVPFSSGFSDPVDIKNCGDERLFVVEQRGYIYIVDTAGNKLPTPFLNIQTRTKYGSEQGLLGLAFPSDYLESGYFYVNYSAQTRGNTKISRFKVDSLNPNLADPNSEELILEIYQPYSNHNGGHLAFGPDGYLYIGTGDGGSGGDPQNRAQNPDTLLGKFLRIEVAPEYSGYKIPATNPYVCTTQPGRPEIWSVGWRNPWRWSFDRCTGDLWVGDVGQDAQEEIDFEPVNAVGGLNYGWRCYEGNASYNLSGCLSPSAYIAPVVTTSHTSSGVCSIIGGYVYRGARYADFFGKYLYSDYCSPAMFTLESDGAGGFINTPLGILTGTYFSGFGEDMWGEIYLASLSSGDIYKFRTNDCTPVASINCNLDTVNDCGYGVAKLSVPAGRGFAYTWYYNGVLMAEDSSIVNATAAGTYVVEVVNPSTACSNTDTIVVEMITPIILTINSLDTLYCISDPSFSLQPSIPGGTFSGPGVNCFMFEPQAAGEGTHEVKYTYETPQGCVYESSQTVRIDLCVGINNNTWLKKAALYPNPNNGTFTLEVSSDQAKLLNIEISSMLGQVLYTGSTQLNSGNTKIQPSYKIKESGIYFVKLSDGESSYVHKISVD